MFEVSKVNLKLEGVFVWAGASASAARLVARRYMQVLAAQGVRALRGG